MYLCLTMKHNGSIVIPTARCIMVKRPLPIEYDLTALRRSNAISTRQTQVLASDIFSLDFSLVWPLANYYIWPIEGVHAPEFELPCSNYIWLNIDKSQVNHLPRQNNNEWRIVTIKYNPCTCIIDNFYSTTLY